MMKHRHVKYLGFFLMLFLLSSCDTSLVTKNKMSIPLSLTSISPTRLAVNGGTLLTIHGKGFKEGMVFSIGNIKCSQTKVISPIEATCVASSKKVLMSAAVTVQTFGTAAALQISKPKMLTKITLAEQESTLMQTFEFMMPPTITSVSPAQGDVAGGNRISILGHNLFSDSLVFIGDKPCDSLEIKSDTEFSCAVPAGVRGKADIKIVNIDGQEAFSKDAYTYLLFPPHITQMDPGNGLTLGSTSPFRILGSNFEGPVQLYINGNLIPSTLVSANQIDYLLPATSSAGIVPVEVVNADGQRDQSQFTYHHPNPVLSSLSFNSAPESGGSAPLTATGQYFRSGSVLVFSGSPCLNTVVSANQIVCPQVPTGVGTVSVKVINPDQKESTTLSFTYVPAPNFSSSNAFEPKESLVDGGGLLTIHGSNFINSALLNVKVAGNTCTALQFISSSELKCTIPSGNEGTAVITLINGDGQSVSTSGFSYYIAPQLLTVNPPAGPMAGWEVTLTGNGFRNGDIVKVNGQNCSLTSLIQNNQVKCQSPALAAGKYDINIQSNHGNSSTLPQALTYLNPAPTLDSIIKVYGKALGGDEITLYGSGFIPGMTVKLGGSNCSIQAIAANRLLASCITGAHIAGTVEAVVTLPDGPSVTLPNAYTYLNPPTLRRVTPNSMMVNVSAQPIVIEGSDFYETATGEKPLVMFSNSGSNFQCLNVILQNPQNSLATHLTCQVAHQVPGTYTLTLTNPDEQLAQLPNALTLTAHQDHWTPVSTTNSPLHYSYITENVQYIWTGSKVISWGGNGYRGCTPSYPCHPGGMYDPITNSWQVINSTNGPNVDRTLFSAVWSGQEMIIWSGLSQIPTSSYQMGGTTYYNYDYRMLQSGGRFDPVLNQWKSMNTDSNSPPGYSLPSTQNSLYQVSPHSPHSVWHDGKMYVWQNFAGGSPPTLTGEKGWFATYTPNETGGYWTKIPLPTSPPGDSPYPWHIEYMKKAGNYLIFCGAVRADASIRWGRIDSWWMRYDLVNQTWKTINMIENTLDTLDIGAPSGSSISVHPRRTKYSLVSTGGKLIFWGGLHIPQPPLSNGIGVYLVSSGAIYDPELDDQGLNPWSFTSQAPLTAKGSPTSIWIGNEMLTFVIDDNGRSMHGAAYNPSTNTWRTTNMQGAPVHGNLAYRTDNFYPHHNRIVWLGPALNMLMDMSDGSDAHPRTYPALYHP